MKRKQILGVVVMGFVALLISVVYVASMPIWIPVVLAKPTILTSITDRVMSKIMQQVTHMMFGSMPSPQGTRIRGK